MFFQPLASARGSAALLPSLFLICHWIQWHLCLSASSSWDLLSMGTFCAVQENLQLNFVFSIFTLPCLKAAEYFWYAMSCKVWTLSVCASHFIQCLEVFIGCVCTLEFMHVQVGIYRGENEDSEGFRSHPLLPCSAFMEWWFLTQSNAIWWLPFSPLLLHKPIWKGGEKICHWCIIAGNADCAGSILGVQ